MTHIDAYFSRRWTRIERMAKGICSKTWNDLINDAYIVLWKKWNHPDKDGRWTDFSGEITDLRLDNYLWGMMMRIHKNNLLKAKKTTSMEEITGYPEGSTEIVYHETGKTFYEWELLEGGYTPEQALKLTNIKFNLHKLKPYERNLYRMYFEEGMTLREIGKRVKLSHVTIFGHLRDLKSKLEEFSKVGGRQY